MTTIHEQFLEQSARLARSYIAATGVTFSPDGHMKVMRENQENGSFAFDNSSSYCGLPYSVDKDQKEDIKVLNAMTHTPNSAVRFAMRGPFGKFGSERPKTMIEIVANSLDAATLCDIIRKWLDGDDATHWGEFEKELDRVVTEHGRFE